MPRAADISIASRASSSHLRNMEAAGGTGSLKVGVQPSKSILEEFSGEEKDRSCSCRHPLKEYATGSSGSWPKRALARSICSTYVFPILASKQALHVCQVQWGPHRRPHRHSKPLHIYLRCCCVLFFSINSLRGRVDEH
jgi:hypothetical protein